MNYKQISMNKETQITFPIDVYFIEKKNAYKRCAVNFENEWQRCDLKINRIKHINSNWWASYIVACIINVIFALTTLYHITHSELMISTDYILYYTIYIFFDIIYSFILLTIGIYNRFSIEKNKIKYHIKCHLLCIITFGISIVIKIVALKIFF